jgi:hypothetical protein
LLLAQAGKKATTLRAIYVSRRGAGVSSPVKKKFRVIFYKKIEHKLVHAIKIFEYKIAVK